MLLKGGHVRCVRGGLDADLDLRLVGGKIVEIGPDLRPGDEQVLDCAGATVAPAFVDLVAELCDPGLVWREDLDSGSRAAAAGGFATVLASPATDPTVDNPAVAQDIGSRARSLPGAKVLVAGALSLGLAGVALAELNLLAEAGCVAFSDGGRTMDDLTVLRAALDYSRPLGLPVLLRPGDAGMESRGVMHEGPVSTRIGLHGIPAEAEEIGVARICALARLTGARVHLTHITTARAVAMLAHARSEGARVTASTPARHLVLTDEAVERGGYSSRFRLLPPLRAEADRQAIIAAVRAGLLSICSDHCPLSRVEKEHEFSLATPGGMGLETAFSAAMTALGDLDVVLTAMSAAPSALLGLDARIALGAAADLVLLRAGGVDTVGPPRYSRGSNEPLAGLTLSGSVVATVVSGRLAWALDPSVIDC